MRIAAARLDPHTGVSHIWLIDAENGSEQRLTFDDAWELQPIWSRDGSRVAFSSNRSGRWEIFEKALSGDGAERLLLSASASVSPEDWSPDGRLLFQQSNLKSHGDFWLATPPSETDAVALPYLESDEGNGRISPDGRWIAYRGYESGWFIYVRPLDSSGARWPISGLVSQWSEPRWRADGKELFYLSADLSLISVDILGDRPFRPGPARLLFHTPAAPPSGASGQAFDIAADGLRMLIKTPASAAPITVVFDWPALTASRR
jgi:Tol biopolymer transport system component